MATLDEDTLVLIAWKYYELGMTHQEIACDLNLSRLKITRALMKAREKGIVQIKITRRLPLQTELEYSLVKRFGLKKAIVVRRGSDEEQTLDEIGRAGANYLNSLVFSECRIGVGYSSTISHMGPFLEAPKVPKKCTVYELFGSFIGSTYPLNICWQIAHALNAPLETLPIPVVLDDDRTRAAILNESAITIAVDRARQCDLAFIGLGNVGLDCSMVRTKHITVEEIIELHRRGAIGDILAHYYDIEGNILPKTEPANVFSLPWEDIHHFPHIVAMASGSEKVEAIVGALRGQLVHSLITDVETASLVLEYTSSSISKTE